MVKNHTVKQGECFSSIAKENGFLKKTLWEHPSNAALREKRKNPNVLLPGDTVVIPDMELKEYDGATEAIHVFQLASNRVNLQLRLLRNDKPRANLKCRLKIAGETTDLQTDGDGWLRTIISATEEKGQLLLQPENAREEEYELFLGHLDPSEEDSGVANRLDNLGFLIGLSCNEPEERKNALASFQRQNKLSQTPDADIATKEKLKQLHGS